MGFNYDKGQGLLQGLYAGLESYGNAVSKREDREREGLIARRKMTEEDGRLKAEKGLVAKRDDSGLLSGYEQDPEFQQRQLQEEIAKAGREGKVINPDGSYGGYTKPRLDNEIAIAKARADAATSPLETEIKQTQLKNAKADAEKKAKEAQNPGSEGERKAAGFSARLDQAEEVFAKLKSEGYDRSSAKEGVKSAVGGLLTSKAKGKLGEQEQAERNFVNAVLRRESGAAISPSEFKNAETQYFDRFGDSPEVLEQKRLNRAQVRENLKTESGPAKVTKVPGTGVKKIKVSNGKESHLIDAADLQEAMSDGFNEVP